MPNGDIKGITADSSGVHTTSSSEGNHSVDNRPVYHKLTDTTGYITGYDKSNPKATTAGKIKDGQFTAKNGTYTSW